MLNDKYVILDKTNLFVNGEGMKKRSAIVLITILWIIIIGCPIFLEFFVFRNDFYSVLSNGEWGGFLGSFIGGIIGGVGTLLAVYFSVRETQKIQRISDNQRIQDKREEVLSEHKKFADEIGVYVAKYITDINKYFYNCRISDRLRKERAQKKAELNKLYKEIEIMNSEQSKVAGHSEAFIVLACKIEPLERKGAILENEMRNIQRELELHKADRSIAIECFYILKIKLQEIEQAKILIQQLDYIHKKIFDEKNEYDWIEKETEDLMEKAVQFGHDFSTL